MVFFTRVLHIFYQVHFVSFGVIVAVVKGKISRAFYVLFYKSM